MGYIKKLWDDWAYFFSKASHDERIKQAHIAEANEFYNGSD